MATPIPAPPSAFSLAMGSGREKMRNFSRRFERKPKALNAKGISALPQVAAGSVIQRPDDEYGAASAPAQSGLDSTGIAPGEQDVTKMQQHQQPDHDSAYSSKPGTHAPDSPDGSPHTPPDNRLSTSSNSTGSPTPLIRAPEPRRRFARLFSRGRDFKLPDLPWLCGTWHVTHTTMPVWRDKRNLQITYTRLPGGKLQDVMAYQLTRPGPAHQADPDRVEHVRGVDSANRDGSYSWRGRGKLTVGRVVGTRWQVLGWGGGGNAAAIEKNPLRDEAWVITYFGATAFSPAGIMICSRKQGGLSERTLRKLMKGLAKVDVTMVEEKRSGTGRVIDGRGNFARLLDGLFVVPRDSASRVIDGPAPSRL